MKCTAVFLVLSLVVLMAEPGEGFIHHIFRGFVKAGKGIFRFLTGGKDKNAQQQQQDQQDQQAQMEQQEQQEQQDQEDQQEQQDRRSFKKFLENFN